MSLLRAFPRPMASFRSFTTTACLRKEEPNNATAGLLHAMAPEAEGGNFPAHRRLQLFRNRNRDPAAPEAEGGNFSSSRRPQLSRDRDRDPAAPGAGGSMSNAQWGAQMIKENKAVTQSEIQASWLRQDLEKQMPRRWTAGDVYAPHDISPVESTKWRRKRTTPSLDAFDTLALDPLKEYKNFSVMSEYMTEMGRIKHSKVTGLRPVNQRRVAKAIRRSIGIGIMPSVHIHPELIKSSVGQLTGKKL